MLPSLRLSLLLVALAAAAFAPALAADKGILELDDHTFTKLIGRDYNVFVEFVEYGWKTSTDYKDVAEHFEKHNDILIAKVDVSDVKSPELKVEKPPVGRFYGKGSTSFDEFSGDLEDANAIIEFIEAGLNPKLKKLADLASSFVSSSNKEAVQKEAESLIAELGDEQKDTTKIYSAMFKRVLEKGGEFAQKEFDRVSKIISGGSLSDNKIKEFKRRLNVLRRFGAKSSDAADSSKEDL